MITNRREFLKAAGAAAAGAIVAPAVARAQAKKGVPKEPVKVGVIAMLIRRMKMQSPAGADGPDAQPDQHDTDDALPHGIKPSGPVEPGPQQDSSEQDHR